MRRLIVFFILATMCMGQLSIARADQTVTVTATSTDISEDLDLKTVATLFGQAKDLEQFEQMLNNPDSAFSNLDLNGDGDVDYLRVIETADEDRHLIVIQAVLAKDIYQDVASIFVEKDPESESVTVQVIGDEYIYGADYIIEPVYIYRPLIYDWFWGPSWVCWHSPFYWDYWPVWWHPYHCIAHHLYWEHCYWHHHYHPICSYRTGHHYRPHYAPMRDRVSRTDYATRHPERSFATRNASRNYSNARAFDRTRQTAVRNVSEGRVRTDNGTATRVSTRSTGSSSRTFGSANVREGVGQTATRPGATRSAAVGGDVSRGNSVSTTTRSSGSVTRSSGSATRSSGSVATPTRGNVTTPTRSSSSSMRSTAPSSSRSSSSSSSMRSSGGSYSSGGSSSMRSSGGSYSSGGSSRGGGSSSSRGGGSSTRR